jgi:hypothetical protein
MAAHADPDRERDNEFDHGDLGRGIANLDPADNLLSDDPDEIMQTGYDPPDRESASLRRARTLEEEREGVGIDDYVTQEEPEADPDDVTAGPPEPRAGRLVTEEEGTEHREEPDGVATDVGPAGYASSAEEAAMHIEDDGGSRRP